MRLWLKLAVVVGVAAGAQWWVDGNAAAIEEAVLTLQCGSQVPQGGGRFNEDGLAAADRLRELQMGRETKVVAAAR